MSNLVRNDALISTLTSKGQITIPIEIRRAAGLEAGSQVEFIVNARRRIELVPRQGDIRALRGTVPVPATAVGVYTMNAAAAQGQAQAGNEPAPPAAQGPQAQSTYRVRLAPASSTTATTTPK
jgi:antitoxin PrlF